VSTFDGQLIQQSTQVANKRDALTVESAYRTQLALGKIGIEPKVKAPTFQKRLTIFFFGQKPNTPGNRQLTTDIIIPASCLRSISAM
jgi:hypothetical protein